MPLSGYIVWVKDYLLACLCISAVDALLTEAKMSCVVLLSARAWRGIAASPKVGSERHSHIANDRQPADNPGRDRRPSRRREHKSPIVDTSRYRVPRCNLTEGDGDAHGDQRHNDPSPESDHRSSVYQRIVCGQKLFYVLGVQNVVPIPNGTDDRTTIIIIMFPNDLV